MKRSKLRIKSAIGHIETLVNDPGDTRRGLAFIAHPHPLHGGTMDNKVVQSIAQTCHDQGYVAIRPNFRGVGSSDGEYTGGIGETEDMLAVIAFVRSHYDATLPIVLAGFSFGGYVQHRVAQQMEVSKLILIGPAVNLYEFGAVPAATTIIHGVDDEVVPFADAENWAQAHNIEFRPINDAGHFFHGKLAELKAATLTACLS
ncbi:MAG: alpha/beta hydrolase [Sulfuriferula sp.]|nr:alpha/beta hydrolase [Sulfuriferula sp.]